MSLAKMKLNKYHFKLKKEISFKNILQNVSKTLGKSYYPIFYEANKLIKEKLVSVGLNIHISKFKEEFEVFINKETKNTLAFRSISLARKENIVDILEIYEQNQEKAIIESLENTIGVKINEGSSLETILYKEVKEKFGQLSPNGKILSDNNSRQKIRCLYDNSIRLKIKKIVSTHGDNV